MSIIPQYLNINKLRTTSARSINSHTISKNIDYSLKSNIILKATFCLNVFEILLFKSRKVLTPAHGVQGAKGLKKTSEFK